MSDRTDSPTEPVCLPTSQLTALVDRLRELGYRVIGPRATDGAIVFDEVASSEELPHGLIDEQDGGRYRLHSSDTAGWFDYVVGPQSVKQFLFPPVETIQEFRRDGASGDWQVNNSPPTAGPTAILGVRSCDVQAVAVQDRVFLHG
ncbi:MAG: sulfite reductase subunit A, partial [Planctomycetales bacterium]|nr:sulfite reductase subunit A [Planctomycetales bacterium]